MEVICGEFGKFTYKKPNIPEGIRLTSVIFPKTEELATGADISSLITAKCVEHMGFLVKSIELKIGDKEIKTYEEMLDEMDLIKYVLTMAEEILGCIDIAIKKKNG